MGLFVDNGRGSVSDLIHCWLFLVEVILSVCNGSRVFHSADSVFRAENVIRFSEGVIKAEKLFITTNGVGSEFEDVVLLLLSKFIKSFSTVD